MRVGIDARLAHYQQAGISTYVRCLIRALVGLQQGDQYVVLEARKAASSFAAEGFEAARAWTPCHSRLEQLTLPVELAPLKLDLLHSPDFIPPFYRRCKSVITVHDLAFLRYPHLLTADSRAYYHQISRAVRSADAIIAVSKATKNDLVEQLDASEEKISVIPEASEAVFQPISDRRLLEGIRQRYRLPENFVLFVGTIEPRKNLCTLIEAFAALRGERGASRPGAYLPELVIAGEKGWLYDDVFSTVEAVGVDDLVRFIGRVTQEDLVGLYNLATALAMPSLYEGFGLPVLEAMACGTPVVAADAASLPEVAGAAALLVDPLDVPGWASAISRISDDRCLREDLGRRGLRRARDFSWQRTAAETRGVYARVLGEAT
ncbi:MAG: glycosyltransferase family 4 protein [Chloroflexi bacterium]|nr:glycosyltransferase family 4 protein [Chloroflexota bacterium]